jgi:intracellular sulfur oxidation DsrE/DsrF family protein
MTADASIRTVLLLTRNGMGDGDTTLTHKLLKTYLELLDIDEKRPATICCYAEGIKHVLDDSPVVDSLRALVAGGVRLIVCGTCVNHYGVANRVAVGQVLGMKDIIAAQWGAAKVITI